MVVRVMSALILAGRVSAQLVFEPQLVGNSTEGAYSPRLDCGDIDGDGDLDVVFSFDVDSVDMGYEVFLNDGTGQLAPASVTKISQTIKGLRLVDLDGDHNLDLVTANGPAIKLRRGAGNATFGPAELVYHTPSGDATQVDVADLTGDGLPDVIVFEGGVVSLLPGHGDGTVLAPVTLANVAPLIAYGVRTADLDGNGVTDVVVLARDVSQPTQLFCVAYVYLGAVGGSYSFAESYPMGDLADVALGALDNDGLPDMVCASTTGVSVWLSLGAGDFQAPLALTSSPYDTGLAVADYDADGAVDVASVCTATHELVFWHGDGHGVLTEGLRLSGADPLGIPGKSPLNTRPLRAADMNGDGRLDLLRTGGDEFGQVHVSVFPNHTYAPTEPFLDQGHALADPGFAGMLLATPILLAEGTMQAGTTVHLITLRHGVESDLALLVLGFDDLLAPFHGGTLVPDPSLLIGPLVFPSLTSSIDLASTIPLDVPPGMQFWLQAWFVPTSGFQDYAATSAVRLTAP